MGTPGEAPDPDLVEERSRPDYKFPGTHQLLPPETTRWSWLVFIELPTD